MNDNIIIEKIWQDQNFFEANIKCSSKSIIASTNIFISNDKIKYLQNSLETFINSKDVKKVYWESGEKGNLSTPCVTFLFSKIDMLGHIRIEVFMELDDGGELSKHNCCFFVNSEMQNIYCFANKLLNILEVSNLTYKISLKNNL